MKKIIALAFLLFLLTNTSSAQQKKLQLSFNTNVLDAHVATEFSLSGNSTFYTAIGFGYGSVSSLNLNKYYDKSAQEGRNSDVLKPEIYFSPYLNIQYRNYFLRARDNRKGDYTGNNSGMYAGARFKFYTAPVISMNEDVESIRQNYMFGLIIGYQKAVGAQRRLVLNANTGISTHANYNLSFFGFKPMLFGSVGYVIK
ncbi:hypothetical protein [Pedobacter frigoris]|uniref:hypothetical protein n=1 Tax=Pedobacter frigoris TaxID=2571272 RepID=UPI00292F52A4|nr:hypothetical protein [Pedobacter frigoris]